MVTFTRAAASELKARIRENIAKALNILLKNDVAEAPDYLKKILERDNQEITKAKVVWNWRFRALMMLPFLRSMGFVKGFSPKIPLIFNLELRVYFQMNKCCK